MYKKILSPLDGSEFAECSLEHVRAIAAGCNVPEVVLLMAVEPIPQYALVDLSEEAHREAERTAAVWAQDYLAKTADALNLKNDSVVVKTAIARGRAADVILDYTSENRVDLIIMSTHGRSGVSRWVFGGVAEKVLRHSPVPVLITSPAACRTG